MVQYPEFRAWIDIEHSLLGRQLYLIRDQAGRPELISQGRYLAGSTLAESPAQPLRNFIQSRLQGEFWDRDETMIEDGAWPR
jgi:hypothetical protein